MNVLDIQGVHARLGDNVILRGVSLQVARGEWLCLLGPNGAGKSTLVKCIVGQLSPVSGEIRICGQSSTAAKRCLGYACSPDQLPGLLTGRQCLEVYGIAKELECIDQDVLTLARELRFTPLMDECVETYSLGARQKLCVLLGLLGEPDLVVLDEAFNGLDPRSSLALKRHLRQRIADQRCGVFLVTHALDIVEHHADAAALLINGVVANHWTTGELERLKLSGGDALERAIAEVASVD